MMKQKLNRIIYVSFTVTGIFSLIMQDYPVTVALLGLAILFDPFNINQSRSEKPFWQKAVFIVQGIIVIGMFIPVASNLLNN
jgi:hypothetical protein